MNTIPWVRFFAAAVVCLWASVPMAQEQPAPTPPPAAEAPATESIPAPAETPLTEPAAGDALVEPPQAAPVAGAKRIVVLPVEFTVYERSVAGVEAVPDWSETARYALGDAAGRMLRQDNRFEIVAMPSLEGDAQELMNEHVGLFKVVTICVMRLVEYGGKAWKAKWADFDYTLGDGLAFLADAAQADYAFFLAGAQIKQTGGSAFMQFLVGTPGGGTFVVIGVVNLRTGGLAWFNWKQGMEIFGMTGSDVRDPATAQAVITKMFEEYPNSKLIAFRPF